MIAGMKHSDFVRAQTPAFQALLRKFPPGCRVQAVVALAVPAPGKVAEVVGWGEPCEDFPEGAVRVREFDGDKSLARCLPSQLEVIGYGRYTPEDIASAIAAKVA